MKVSNMTKMRENNTINEHIFSMELNVRIFIQTSIFISSCLIPARILLFICFHTWKGKKKVSF